MAVLTTGSACAALGLLGGFAAGRYTTRRDLAGAVFAVAGTLALREWRRTAGTGPAVGLAAGYAAAMGASHPLAKRLGAWPAVAAVTAATVTASELTRRLADR